MPNITRMVFATSLTFILCSTVTYADKHYQTEILGGYGKINSDTSPLKTITTGAEVYFTPVNTENKPLAGAAFLDKKSSVGAGYINAKSDYKNSSINSIELGGPLVLINYITGTDAFILGAVYSEFDGDTNPSLVASDTQTVGFTIGKYINDSTTVEASYTSSKSEYRNTITSQTTTFDIDSYDLAYTTIQELGTTSYYSFRVGFELIKEDSSTSVKENSNNFMVSGGYYFSRMTSLDLTAIFSTGDNIADKSQALAISFTHFIAPQIALKVGLSKSNTDDNNTEDAEFVSLDVIIRI
ncbi:MAG: putative porin [Gammaproteobacteria bacterium]|nr:putative porin [Gammaproteobacteria bacterium]